MDLFGPGIDVKLKERKKERCQDGGRVMILFCVLNGS
jgi:hypothetical protein